MNIFTKLRDFLSGRPSLRNRPGGLAWVKPHDIGTGAEQLAGVIVTTVRVVDGFWRIEPEVSYVARGDLIDRSGNQAPKGSTVIVIGMHDSVLVPIPDAKLSKSEVTELYLSAPVKRKETA